MGNLYFKTAGKSFSRVCEEKKDDNEEKYFRPTYCQLVLQNT